MELDHLYDLDCVKRGIFFYTQKHNKTWLLLNYINLNAEYKAWTDFGEAQLSFLPHRYSVLSYLSDSYKINSEFEFLLEYPEHGYNNWYQTSNPMEENETDLGGSRKAEGYRDGDIQFTVQFWGGLVRSYNSPALLDGSTYHLNYHYAIGCTELYVNLGLPGYDNYETTISILWVRVPKIPPSETYFPGKLPLAQLTFTNCLWFLVEKHAI